jgi:hypothetical protein
LIDHGGALFHEAAVHPVDAWLSCPSEALFHAFDFNGLYRASTAARHHPCITLPYAGGAPQQQHAI